MAADKLALRSFRVWLASRVGNTQSLPDCYVALWGWKEQDLSTKPKLLHRWNPDLFLMADFFTLQKLVIEKAPLSVLSFEADDQDYTLVDATLEIPFLNLGATLWGTSSRVVLKAGNKFSLYLPDPVAFISY